MTSKTSHHSIKLTLPTTMKAVALEYKKFNPKVVTVPRPVPQPDEILVKVRYAAMDTGTEAVVQKTIMGHFVHAKTKPLVLGWHFGGKVAAVGSKIDGNTDLHIGDEVWGFLQYAPDTKQGSYAEYVTVRPSECAKKPDGVDLATATAAATEAVTALQAMRDEGGLLEPKPSASNASSSSSSATQPSVLVLGAGGGLGSVAVQIAKRLGAHVTAVCSTKDVKRVQDFGADVVIDRKKTKNVLSHSGTMYDVIFDTPCMYSAPKCMRWLRSKGAYVTTLPSVGLFVGKILSVFNGKRSMFIECKSKRADLDLIGIMLQDGLRVDICETFKIKDMDRAMAKQADSRKVGRVMIEVEGGW